MYVYLLIVHGQLVFFPAHSLILCMCEGGSETETDWTDVRWFSDVSLVVKQDVVSDPLPRQA